MSRLPYFKAYDIRGRVPEELDGAVARRLGGALPAWAQAVDFVVGRDARLSSPALAEALIRGLVEAGARVRDIGMVTTPMLNFAAARRRCYGVMVTASHNPKDYNGFKVIDPQAEQVYYGRGLENLETLVAAPPPPAAAAGSVVVDSILAEYCDALAARFGTEPRASCRVIFDCANGVGALPLGLLERLGVRHTLLFHVPDGAFPNHGPDTLRPENLETLRHAVREERADLGVMFDGDADRIAVVDERGASVPPEGLLLVLAREALARRPGSRIFYDLRMSHAVREEIERLGGKPVTMRVGNPFYKEALHRSPDGVLAAELSGHVMFAEHYGVDDALYAALKLLSAMGTGSAPLSQRFAALDRYSRSGEIRIETDRPQALVARARAQYADGRAQEIDGITVEYPEWWFNVRASNTEPIVKVVIEAGSEAALAARRTEVLQALDADKP